MRGLTGEEAPQRLGQECASAFAAPINMVRADAVPKVKDWRYRLPPESLAVPGQPVGWNPDGSFGPKGKTGMKHVDVAVIAARCAGGDGADILTPKSITALMIATALAPPFLIGSIHFAREYFKAKKRSYRPPQWDERFRN